MAVKQISLTQLSRFWTDIKAYLTANYGPSFVRLYSSVAVGTAEKGGSSYNSERPLRPNCVVELWLEYGNTAASPTFTYAGITYTFSGMPTRARLTSVPQCYRFRLGSTGTTLTYLNGNDMDVYIVEKGAVSGWEYRIWSDNTLEGWAVKNDSSYAMTTAFASGGFYGPQLTMSFPTTFAAAPYIQITTITPNMGWGMIAAPTTTYTYYRAINRTSATGTITSYFYIKGTLA